MDSGSLAPGSGNAGYEGGKCFWKTGIIFDSFPEIFRQNCEKFKFHRDFFKISHFSLKFLHFRLNAPSLHASNFICHFGDRHSSYFSYHKLFNSCIRFTSKSSRLSIEKFILDQPLFWRCF